MTNNIHDALKTGLSAKAGAVYVCLLQAGAALPPKAIVIRTKLHRQYVYDALEELQGKLLILKEGEKRRIRYKAASPDRLLQDAEKQRLDAMEGVRGLMKLYDRSPAGIVEIIRGSENVIENEFELLQSAEKGDFLHIIGGAGMQWVNLFKDRIEEWEKLRKEKNIQLRYIGSGDDVRHNREESVIQTSLARLRESAIS